MKITGTIVLIGAIFVSLFVAGGFYGISYFNLSTVLETEAEEMASFITQYINSNPELWQYEQPRLEEVLNLHETKRPHEHRRIVDNSNRIIAQGKQGIKGPWMIRSRSLYDSGRIVGKIAIYHSLGPLFQLTLLVGIVALVVVGLICFMLKPFIVRAIQKHYQVIAEREAERQKMASLESLGFLAGGIAHDFNNFLSPILGNLSLIAAQISNQDKIYYMVSQAEKATLKARALAQQLLTFSKGGTPHKKLIALPEIIKTSAVFALTGSPVRCEFTFQDDTWAVEADPDQIGQVVNNLTLNAIQAMPTGGLIKIQTRNMVLTADNELPLPGGRYVKVAVHDQGIGIENDNLEKIFDPYFTTKERGSGLGLASAYSIVNRHGGYITVRSEPGIGSIFCVYLPASEKEVSSGAQEFDRAKLTTGKGRILIMDDEEIVREVVGKMTSYLGYEVEYAADGEEAIGIYLKARENGRPFDAVIMDLTIPGGMGGKETIKRLLEIDPQVKSIVSSGYSDDPIIAHYKDYGFRGAIKKPYRVTTLSKVLTKCLEASQAMHLD